MLDFTMRVCLAFSLVFFLQAFLNHSLYLIHSSFVIDELHYPQAQVSKPFMHI